jgi:hypothetical protein
MHRGSLCIPRVSLLRFLLLQNVVTRSDGWWMEFAHMLCLSVYLSVSLSIYLSIYQSINQLIPGAPTWSIGHPRNVSFHFSCLILYSWYDALGGGSAQCKAATYTEQNKHRINAEKEPCLGIRTLDSRVGAGEDISCLRHRGHCDRPSICLKSTKPLLKEIQSYKK